MSGRAGRRYRERKRRRRKREAEYWASISRLWAGMEMQIVPASYAGPDFDKNIRMIATVYKNP